MSTAFDRVRHRRRRPDLAARRRNRARITPIDSRVRRRQAARQRRSRRRWSARSTARSAAVSVRRVTALTPPTASPTCRPTSRRVRGRASTRFDRQQRSDRHQGEQVGRRAAMRATRRTRDAPVDRARGRKSSRCRQCLAQDAGGADRAPTSRCSAAVPIACSTPCARTLAARFDLADEVVASL
jgi:hypothetical protein